MRDPKGLSPIDGTHQMAGLTGGGFRREEAD
jgi:hypothetical protein